jgi:uncharacterized membrane protein YdjX (TVP38/TMEM64 family)
LQCGIFLAEESLPESPMSALINWLTQSQHYFQNMGWVGILVFAAVTVGIQLFLAPTSPMAIAGGMFFGFCGGLVSIEIGTTLGIVINFLIARYVARNAIAHRLEKHEKFRLIDQAIGEQGGKIVLLLRFCPIPFGLANFCYGLTAVRFWPYFFASVAGVTPGNLFFTWMGTTANASLSAVLGAHRARHPFEYVMMFVGLAAGFIALTYISRIARAAVANREHVEPASGQN